MDHYEKLRLLLDAHPSGAPKSEAFDNIIRILFSPAEAAVAAAMGFSPRPAETIAAACGIPAETAEGLLERMADRAVVFCREKEGCCPCCCTILRGITQLNLPHPFATSGFQAEVNPDGCNGCGVCADERCPVGAIELRDDIAVVTAAKCIGCGLCVTACPTEALSLVRQELPPEIPATAQEMGMKVLSEKGKLEAFMLASKR